MTRVRPAQPIDPARPNPGAILCPYCGAVSANPKRCEQCSGFFDPLSRQASQNAMGPWFLHDPAQPFRPGFSYETLKELIRRGKIVRGTVMRGPTTRQFWSFAGRTPSVANLLGVCHNCQAEVNPDAFSCAACGAVFSPETDRQHMGLAPIHLLPGQATPEMIAAMQAPAHAEPVVTARTTPAVAIRETVRVEHAEEPARRSIWPYAAVAGLFGLLVGLGGGIAAYMLAQPEPVIVAPAPLTPPGDISSRGVAEPAAAPVQPEPPADGGAPPIAPGADEQPASEAPAAAAREDPREESAPKREDRLKRLP